MLHLFSCVSPVRAKWHCKAHGMGFTVASVSKPKQKEQKERSQRGKPKRQRWVWYRLPVCGDGFGGPGVFHGIFLSIITSAASLHWSMVNWSAATSQARIRRNASE
jgi:hypothetical protein